MVLHYTYYCRMHITFGIHNSHTLQWSTSNLFNRPIRIRRITTLNNNSYTYGLILNRVNNARLSCNTITQSPLLWINRGCNTEIVNIVVPPSLKWDFYLIDNAQNNVTSDYEIQVVIDYELVYR